MVNGSGFEVVLASFPEREKLVAEIYCEGKFVALVSQDGTARKFLIELPGCDVVESNITRTVELNGFTYALGTAMKALSGDEVEP
jgi:hypothetical protein